MAVARTEVSGNFVFSEGSLWLPTHHSVTNETKKPRFLGGDFGSMMPYVRMNIPNIWDSVIIPYENIIDFEFSVIKGVATISFLDQTPIFIQEITRRFWNKKLLAPSKVPLQLEFGWRIQNPPDGIKDEVSKDGIYSSDLMEMEITNVSYKYSDFGVMCSMTMQKMSKRILDGFITKKGTFDPSYLFSHEAVEQEIARVVNNAVHPVGAKFFVKFLSPEIDISDLELINLDGTMSAYNLISLVNSNLKIFNQSKDNSGSSVPSVYVGEKQIKINTGQGEQEFYPIYFYNRTKTSSEGSWIPQLEYPSNESSIISWEPKLDATAGNMWKRDTTTKITDGSGNEEVVSIETQAVTAGMNAPTATGGDSAVQTGSDREIGSQPLKRVVLPELNVDIMGDPLFTTLNIHMTTVNVLHNIIEQDGIVRDGSSFFDNFKGVTPILRQELANIEGIPFNESPFNGEYIIMDVIHKISTNVAYVTQLELKWKYSARIQ